MLTKDAAVVLELSLRTVQAHIKRGNLKAKKIGRDYWIEDDELKRFQREQRKPGKPKAPRAGQGEYGDEQQRI